MSKKRQQLIIVLLLTLMHIKFKSWRMFPKYYKGMFFISFLNSFYYYLCKRHLVWEFTHVCFKWRLLRAVHIFYVTPSLVLLFLTKLPNSISQQTVYLINWLCASFIFEYYLVRKNILRFKHRWNLYWSLLVYLKIYVYAYLYTIKPLVTWVLSIFSAIFFSVKFKVPLKKRLFKGPFFLLYKKRPLLFPFEIRFK